MAGGEGPLRPLGSQQGSPKSTFSTEPGGRPERARALTLGDVEAAWERKAGFSAELGHCDGRHGPLFVEDDMDLI